MLADILSRYWWMTLLRGIFWILFGIVIFARPGISLLSLTFALGVVMFVDGIINAANAFSGRKEHDDWWVLLLVGLAGIGIGLLTFYNPAATALAVVLWTILRAILLAPRKSDGVVVLTNMDNQDADALAQTLLKITLDLQP